MRLMKVVVAGTLLASTSCAFAADMSVKARPAPVAVAPVFSWTGFYVGAHLGWGWGTNDHTNVNGTVPFPAGTTASINTRGVIGGGQIGYNFQLGPNWLIGIEGEGAGSGIDGAKTRTSVVTPATRVNTITDKVDWLASVAGRLGYVNNNWLFYGKGGWAWAGYQTDGRTFNPAAGGALVTATTGSSTRNGYLIGGGIEWAFLSNWTAKIEYNYINFQSETNSLSVVVDNTGNLGVPIRNTDSHLNIIKAGVNYKF